MSPLTIRLNGVVNRPESINYTFSTEPHRVSFESSIIQPAQPDMLIKLGHYFWVVHKYLLVNTSGFFAAALEGPFQEASKNVTDLHDDDVWSLARFVQFLYYGTYGIDEDERPTIPDHKCLSLSALMLPFGTVSNFKNEEQADRARDPIEIHCRMIVLADKYDVPLLYSYALKQIRPHLKQRESFWAVYEALGANLINRKQSLHEAMACVASKDNMILKDARIDKWFEEDADFSIEIIRSMRGRNEPSTPPATRSSTKRKLEGLDS